jgi:hypothetical protein
MLQPLMIDYLSLTRRSLMSIRLLQHMRQLMCHQGIPYQCPGPMLAACKRNVIANGESPRIHTACQVSSTAIRMYRYVRKACPERHFHLSTGTTIHGIAFSESVHDRLWIRARPDAALHPFAHNGGGGLAY